MILENKNNRIIIKANSRAVSLPEDCTDNSEIFVTVCRAIREGGYDPVSQIVGYIISEDPTHITNYQNARTLIGKLDRDELLNEMAKHYIEYSEQQYDKKKRKK